jgi:DNA-binding transcriptional ArsR family regulator
LRTAVAGVGDFDSGLLKTLGHPLRLQILETITIRGEASAVGLAREFDQPVRTVSHHTRVLRDLGFIEVTRTEPRRGAVEQFYRAMKRPFIEDAEWERLPVVMRRGLARQVFRQIFAEASDAGTAGGFDDPGAYLTRFPLELDERGWEELSSALISTIEQADEIQRRSDDRRASTTSAGDAVRASVLTLLHFRVSARARETHKRHRRPSLR